ncbi:MAG TPA: hypothetical protein VJ801_18230 [Polyangia bacterium]|nr:hypothetical protein [Polyangia bacterium]
MAGAALLLCLAGTAVFAVAMNRVFPIHDWLAWTLAQIWGWVFLFSLSTFCFGRFVMVRVLRLDQLPVLESAVFSAAIGTVGFTLAMYLAGALALYDRAFAIALPLVFVAIGARDGFHLGLQLARSLRLRRHSLLSTAASSLGVLCLGLIYLGLLSPDAVNYDSSWYHLRIAQDYARWGRIGPIFDYNAIFPHLASILHTWGYLVPGLDGAPRWMMALHMEFALFLWTLVGVAAGVQRLTGDFTLKATWVSFFLFPIIFVYDNNIGGSADHVLAFFAVPVVLATLQLQNGFTKGRCALLAIAFAGASLTKYQAVYLAGPVALIAIVLWIRDWIRSAPGAHGASLTISRRELLWAPAILVGVCLVLVAPHLLKNYLFYRNPVYPFLLQVFTNSTPTVPNATVLVNNVLVDPGWVPTGSFFARLWHALGLFFTFSFKPHYSFSKDVPAFGSLFTLLLPTLLLVPARRAIALAALIATGALLAWGMTYNVDRNLQTFMPILVCVTGALLVKLWRLGWLARIGLVPLVALQIVWGADAPFYGGRDRIDSAIGLIRSTFDGRAKSRFEGYRSSFVAVGKSLPHDAKVLLHGSHVNLGIDRDTLQDMAGFQGLISYHKVRSPRELFDYYRSLGITHTIGTQFIWDSSRQEEILYDLLLRRYGVPAGVFGGISVTAMPEHPPPVETPYHVLCLGLDGYADGLYPIDALNVNEHLAAQFRHYPTPERPVQGNNASELLRAADVAVVRNLRGDSELASTLAAAFEQIPTHGDATVYARRR